MLMVSVAEHRCDSPRPARPSLPAEAGTNSQEHELFRYKVLAATRPSGSEKGGRNFPEK